MAREMRPLTFLLTSLLVLLHAANEMIAATTDTSFIESSCSTTRYPTLCVQSLSAYALEIKQNPCRMTQTALTVTLARARTTRDFVVKSSNLTGLKPLEYNVITDCMEQIKDGKESLRKSVEEMKKAGQSKGPDLTWRMNNIQTWVSAVMTNANTCDNTYSSKALNGRLKDSIRARALNLVQVTCNTLALINRLASKA